MGMELTQVQAFYGLRAIATPTGTNISNDVQIGESNTAVSLTGDVAYSLRAIFAGGSDVLALDLTTNDTTGSTAWVAGTAQVETATAAGTITGSGNATVVVTAAGMISSPRTISVAVVNGDTPTQWAAKVRAALESDAGVSALFTVGGSTTSITLTRKPTTSYTVGTSTVGIYPADDTTLNIRLDNGTCTGITTASTSANTTAGVATDGVKIYDGDGNDFEGVAIPALSTINSLLIKNAGSGSITATGSTDSFPVGATSGVLFFPVGSGVEVGNQTDLDFTSSDTTDLSITVIGTAA